MDVPAPSAELGVGSAIASAQHRNLFDFLRLFAATLVLWGHAFSLTGQVAPGCFGNAIGTIGVKIFFVISGLMITRSWLADSRLGPFALRRALRIMPALILVVLLTSFVIGPLATVLPKGDYFRNGATWFYLRNILLFPVYALPGVFGSNPYPGAVNGSLWSLPAEVCMYLLTPLVIGRRPVFARISIIVVAGLFTVCGLYCVRINPLHPAPVFYGTSLLSLLDVAAYFQIGAIFAVFSLDRLCRPVFSLLLLLVCGAFVRHVGRTNDIGSLSEVLLLFTLPYAVISVGSIRLTGRLGRLLAKPDFSYGMYLYGFPVEQLISSIFHGQISAMQEFYLALPVTFLCGAISWATVERIALRLKPRRLVSNWINV